MSDQFQLRPSDDRPIDLTRRPAPLPEWIARRMLGAGEHVSCVYGPQFNPPWERHVTHPALFLSALGAGGVVVAIGLLWRSQGVPDALPLAITLAAALVLGSVFVLGISCGYFTRLVVTNRRLVVVQGYEVCKTWSLNDLPRSLLRFTPVEDEADRPEVDLNALQAALGASSNQFADAKTILRFGKHLDQIKRRPGGPS